MIQLSLFANSPRSLLLEEWLNEASAFKELPEIFTIWRTVDLIDLPTDYYDTACDGTFPNGLGGVYVIFTEWYGAQEGRKGHAWRREYLYVGKALDVRQRLLGHFRRPSSSPLDRWLDYGHVWDTLEDKWLWCAIAPCPMEQRAALELTMIKDFQPKFNVVKA